MGRFIKGDVVVLPFPFSDLSSSKKRPALVLSDLKGDDVILCQITSQFKKDSYAVALLTSDFNAGQLKQESYIRPNRIFTADESIILYKSGSIRPEKFKQVRDRIVHLLDQ